MASGTSLPEKFLDWLDLMKRAHPEISPAELARRLGVPAESYFHRKTQRPGVFNANTLECMSRAMGVPAWLILQAIETGRPIEVHRELA